MFLVWCKDRADTRLEVHKIYYKSEEKDVIKFRGSISYPCGHVLETKNYTMSLTRFKQLQRIDG